MKRERGCQKKDPKGFSRREFLKYTGATLGAVGIAGLLPNSNRAFAAVPKAGGHFKPATVGFTVHHTFDPALVSLIGESQVTWTMFNSLVRFDANMNIVPDLAQSWTTPDETTYRFKLYPGIKFHDGSDCTAEDVVFSLDRVRDAKTGSPNRSKLSEVDTIKAIDEQTVEITTKGPFAPLMAYLCNARTGTQIVSRKAVERLGADFGKKPIGTGPYKMVDWKPGEKIEFERHSQYFMKGWPYLEKVTEVLIAEESTATNAILSGDVDLTSTVLFSDVKSLEKAKGIKVMKQPGLNIRFVQMNCRVKPFDDPFVRQAFSYAFDRKQLIDAVIYGEGVEVRGIIPPSIQWACHPQIKTQTFNPEKARELLKRSKYKKTDLNVSVLTFGTGWWKRFAEIVAAQAGEVLDIPVKAEVIEAGTIATRYQEGNYQCGVWGWLGLVEPDEYAYENFHSKGSKNTVKYYNPEVDELLDKARKTLDRNQRVQYYHQAEEIIGEDAPYAFCFTNLVHNAMKDYVMDFIPIPFSAFGQQFDRVWLAKS
jgi:peptide/nickel transport system substrate-binding protein